MPQYLILCKTREQGVETVEAFHVASFEHESEAVAWFRKNCRQNVTELEFEEEYFSLHRVGKPMEKCDMNALRNEVTREEIRREVLNEIEMERKFRNKKR